MTSLDWYKAIIPEMFGEESDKEEDKETAKDKWRQEAEENGFGLGCTVNSTTSWCKGAEFGYNKALEEIRGLIKQQCLKNQ